MMTTRNQNQGMAGRLRRWNAMRKERRGEIDMLAALDQLNDQLLRDIGMCRNQPTGSRRTPEWM